MKVGIFRKVVFVLNVSDIGKALLNVGDITLVKPLSKNYVFAKWLLHKFDTFSILFRSALPNYVTALCGCLFRFFTHFCPREFLEYYDLFRLSYPIFPSFGGGHYTCLVVLAYSNCYLYFSGTANKGNSPLV